MTNETHHTNGDSPSGDLNEVLRLQAVALARMTERMNAHQAGPAKPLPVAHDRSGGHLPVLASDVALSEDSMPVLNAFREFLEQERRRARARILWISLVFAVLFVVCVSVLVWMGRERMSELRADIGDASRKMEVSRESAKSEIRQITENANRSVSALKMDINSTMNQAQALLVSNLNARLRDRDGEMDLLKEKLSSLEIENAVLMGRLREMRDAEEVRRQEADDGAMAPVGEPAATNPVPEEPEGSREEPGGQGPRMDKGPVVIQTPAYNRAVRLKAPVMEP